ncbi:MAG: hypothetical protein CVV64_13815 [Candidatus Wallbacteria bacterium HGW-Wallbacteria-1]|uniref:Uncharacterized protein n=1 Tax=Candidatus Wallbacteria bacterium HGW-Wallbacteria-1 TaxID=2013854 RepID=A0A2N1PMI2_9BACT|nr:MAG: hypothetical protein CVV64_13815 [Candidatus Wallbacteria bacterium HGW-Wallbacteria-1]
MKGAGGTNGGVGQFFLGLAMMCGGFYFLLKSITVTSSLGMGMGLYRLNYFGGQTVTSGMIMIPFIFGTGIIFYNYRNILGWILSVGSVGALIFGVISSIQFTFRAFTAFDLIVILVLAFGGMGLFLKSLKEVDTQEILNDE